jgi:chorismate mutase
VNEPAETPRGLGEVLAALRRQIDSVDTRIVHLLAARKRLVEEIRAVKESAGLAMYMPEREAELLDVLSQIAVQRDLDPAYVRELFMRIIAETRPLSPAASAKSARASGAGLARPG